MNNRKKTVMISVGPIPSRLDSVKFITNKFKGGLALKTAEYIASQGHDVTVFAWDKTELKTTLPVIRVYDVMDYYHKVLNFNADTYILAGAVANLMPSNPYEGKFPSHQYSVGEKFNIEFEIAPRVIDEIKKHHPRSTLIAYKLYDSDNAGLIEAGKKTLFDSMTNVVFANHPAWAKEKKIVLTQDGAIFECSFDSHCEMIVKLIESQFFKTHLITKEGFKNSLNSLSAEEKFVIQNYPTDEKDGRTYGTFAIRQQNKDTYSSSASFLTTTRGKAGGKENFCLVDKINFLTREIFSTSKATLNAPLLGKFLEVNPTFQFVIHGHELIGNLVHPEYEFAGTDGDLKFAVTTQHSQPILLPHHGYIVGFEQISQLQEFISSRSAA